MRRSLAVLLLLVGAGGPAQADKVGEQARRALREGRAAAAAARLLARVDASASAEQLYWSGRLLEAAGQRSSALERYLTAVLRRPQRIHADAARRLARDPAFPLAARGLRRLAAMDLGQIEDPELRVALLHRVALFQLRSGDREGARRSLQAQGARPRARYLLGVLALRQGQPARARRLFERALSGARRRGNLGLVELCGLALARLDLESGRLERARRRYLGIPYGSPHFFRARQELAWLELDRSDPAAALAQSVVLSAPALRRYFRPDRGVVEAAAMLGLCQRERATARAQEARRLLARQAKTAANFLRHRPDPRLYYVEAMESAVRGGGGLSAGLVAALLADPGFRRAFQTVRQLQRERRLLLRTGAAELRGVLSTELDRRLVTAQERAGRTVQGIVSRVHGELRELRTRLQELQFDLEGQAVTEAIQGGKTGKASSRDRARPIARKGQQQWPFRGEFWADEVGLLRITVPPASSCQSSSR